MYYLPPCPSWTSARLAAVRTPAPVGLKSDLRGACAPATRLGSLLALGLLAAAPAALAALDGADLLELPFAELLEMEIRSAGKREEHIRNIPASVTIVEREEIERYGWLSLAELLRNVPGFYLLDNIEDRFIGTRGAAGGGVQLLVNGIAQHPSLQKTLTGTESNRLAPPTLEGREFACCQTAGAGMGGAGSPLRRWRMTSAR